MLIKIDEELKNAMKNKDKTLLYVLRMIKSRFLEYRTSKGFDEKNWNDATECQILMKLEKEWNDELQTLINAGRNYEEINNHLLILRKFIPAPPSKELIKDLILKSNIEPSIKNIKNISNYIKNEYPSTDNKIIVECVKTM